MRSRRCSSIAKGKSHESSDLEVYSSSKLRWILNCYCGDIYALFRGKHLTYMESNSNNVHTLG